LGERSRKVGAGFFAAANFVGAAGAQNCESAGLKRCIDGGLIARAETLGRAAVGVAAQRDHRFDADGPDGLRALRQIRGAQGALTGIEPAWISAAKMDRAFAGDQTESGAHQACLAGAVGTEECNHLSGVDAQRYAFNNAARAKCDGDVIE
jgi:hypothetical protein